MRRRLRITGAEIAESMTMTLASGIPTRTGLGKLSGLELPKPLNRCQRELINIDVKRLERIGQRIKLGPSACPCA